MRYYSKNDEPVLNDELFKAPTSEYRGAPFWAWNSKLDHDQLREQIDIFKEMGLGGFNMHVRQGLETLYMSKEFMDAVRACCEKAKEEGMLAWAYDEDRWPSGCVGGALTKDMKYRLRYLLMTVNKKDDYTNDIDVARNEGTPLYLCSFSVKVDENGYMVSCKKVGHDSKAEGVRHFYCMTVTNLEPRFNYSTYSDTMSKETIDKFIEMTHEVYKKEVGEYFGNSLPAFFTDEPQMRYIDWLKNGFSQNDAGYPFTLDYPKTFEERNGYDICDLLPHVFFASKGDEGRKVRYDYFRHVSERFNEAFADNVGDWCEKNGVMLSGHALGEDTLYEQVLCCYESMRLYKNMQLPGIDCLFADKNFTAAIQCRSVVNQYAKQGMLSELYGVTNWDFDLRDHKFHGDWQACLGVTVRCQHLAWQSMKGEGKRDYPASIFYQSPWYKEYRYVEDHFARLNTALSRGKSANKVAVVHPLESYWMEKASWSESKMHTEDMDTRFADLANWLITGMVDFDYLSESLLPDICPKGGAPLKVGQMSYSTIIVCDCVTLRKHTIKLLEEFKAAGGRLIFIGETPRMCEASPSGRAKALVGGCEKLNYSKTSVRNVAESVAKVKVFDANGAPTEHIIHTERKDNGKRWMFFTHSIQPELKQRSFGDNLTISIKGLYDLKIYDTVTGEIKNADYEHKDGRTVLHVFLYSHDSLLLSLEKTEIEKQRCVAAERVPIEEIALSEKADYKLSEPNVLLLDVAEFSLDNAGFEPKEEILRIDAKVRAALGYDLRKTKVVQPYVIIDAPEDHTLTLRYTVNSEIDVPKAAIALENAEKCSITLNGNPINGKISGWYIDKDIKTIELGGLVKGENVITVTMPLGVRTDLESAYLIGEFGVKCFGAQPVICELPEKLYFGDATIQGLSFYGGNITYTSVIDVDEDCDLEFETSYYIGGLVRVTLDSDVSKRIVYAPYRAVFENVKKGKHTVEFTVYGNRYNTLSALHATASEMYHLYNGPAYWRTEQDAFSYEYNLIKTGMLKTPVVRKLAYSDNEQRVKVSPGYIYNAGPKWGKHIQNN